jgi:SAM-dependent methyltransferase
MSDAQRLDLQVDYWNRIGPTKPFAHPINIDQLSRLVSPQSRILDYGCGYGRALGFLHSYGFSNLIGVDPMPAMIEAARRKFPAIPFEVLDDYQKVQLDDASVDAVLLFAVLTSVPTNDGQRAIIAEITRVLRPDGILYISDMFLQTDPRNLERYLDGEKKYGIYGVFDLSEGAVVRHHERSWIEKLTADYETLNLEQITVPTMNLHPAAVFQWLGRKSRVQ